MSQRRQRPQAVMMMPDKMHNATAKDLPAAENNYDDGSGEEEYLSSDSMDDTRDYQPRVQSALLPPLPVNHRLHEQSVAPVYEDPEQNPRTVIPHTHTSPETTEPEYFNYASLHVPEEVYKRKEFDSPGSYVEVEPSTPRADRDIPQPRVLVPHRQQTPPEMMDYNAMNLDGAYDENDIVGEEATADHSFHKPSTAAERTGRARTSTSSEKYATTDDDKFQQISSLTAQTAMFHEHELAYYYDVGTNQATPSPSSIVCTKEHQHYEGCILCDPLPSPRESTSSASDLDEQLAQLEELVRLQNAGPPPDEPLPELPSPEFLDDKIVFHSGQLPPVRTRFPTIPPFPVQYHIRAPIYASPSMQHGHSLSTVIEREEEDEQIRKSIQHQSARASQQPSTPKKVTYSPFPPAESSKRQQSLASQNDLAEDSKMSQPQANLGTLPVQPAVKRPSYMASIEATMQSILRNNHRNEPSTAVSPVTGSVANHYHHLSSSKCSDHGIQVYGLGSPGPEIENYKIDGAYEMTQIDLSTGQTIPPQTDDNNRPPKKPSPVSRYFGVVKIKLSQLKLEIEAKIGKRALKWTMIGSGIFLALLFIVLMVTTVGFRNIAQQSVNKAKVNVTGVTMSEFAPDSLKMELQVLVNGGDSAASILPNSAFRLSKAGVPQAGMYDGKPDLAGLSKRSHIPTHIPVGGNTTAEGPSGILGYAEINKKTTLKDSRKVELLGQEEGNRFKVTDTELWGDVIQTVLFSDKGYEVDVEGDVHVKHGLLKSSPRVKKTVKLPSMNGPNAQVLNFTILKHDSAMDFTVGFMTRTMAPVSLLLKDVTFDLVFNETAIGTVFTPKFDVWANGTSQDTLLSGRGYFNTSLFNQQPGLYSQFLSALHHAHMGSPRNNMVRLRGSHITANGHEIGWMHGAISRLEMSFALPPPDGIEVDNSTKKLDMAFSVVDNGEIHSPRSGYIKVDSIFGVANSSAYSLHIETTDGRGFGHIEIPPDAAPTKSTRTFADARIEVEDAELYASEFLRRIIQSDNATFLVSGTADGKTEFSPMQWPIGGLGGFKEGASLEDIRFVNADNDGVALSAALVISSNASMGISLKDVKLQLMLSKDDEAAFGDLTVPIFNVTRGSNYMGAMIQIPSKSDAVAQKKFFSSIFGGNGGKIAVNAYNASSKSTVINSALDGLNFTASISSQTPHFIDKISFPNSESGMTVAMTFTNTFRVDTTVTSFEITVKGIGTGRVLGRIAPTGIQAETIAPGDRKDLSALFVPEDNITEASMKEYTGGLVLTGSISLRWGATNVVVGFEKEVRRAEANTFLG